MPTPIPNPSGWLSSLLSRLGIPRLPQLALSDTVQQVAVVDSYVNLTVAQPIWGVPSSAGESAVPAANTRLADTGALAAGNYEVMALVSHNDAGGNSFRLRRRNAADAADVWSMRFQLNAGSIVLQVRGRFALAVGERLVVENVAGAAVATVYQASIFLVSS